MEVIARKGLRVPMETGRRRYVTDSATVDVPNSVYYRRRIAEGDLLTGDAAATPRPASPADVPATTIVAPDTSATPAGDKKSAKGA